ncbi:MAG: PDZ domain-containing protein [Reichenbachiella sp.]|uniref:M61 family metallopeptidase n=1 Tax=Reichenbachiella sp. TaxID=2184521 RepID=UPI003263937D
MINCHISSPNPLTHLLHIELKLKVKSLPTLELILPTWRPGRYELAPFAENIQRFSATDRNGSALTWRKSRPNKWLIDTAGIDLLVVRYQYYANKMDAGNSVLDDSQVYINFINCIFYTALHDNQQISLQVDLPKGYLTSCSMLKTDEGLLLAENYQQLADSPLLASPNLKTLTYSIDKYRFNIVFNGEFPLDESQILKDFKKFTACQIAAMGGFPTRIYDFIVQSLDYAHYHGVEHQNSTVLVLGPNDESSSSEYFHKLMGVASHELFHTWNVTRIRPMEMSPYRFDEETMTESGFVTEGFTTYYGDLFLAQSGVLTQNGYFKELNALFKRHFENYGRHESSLIQASANLWVDGYKNLFPSKKVSIYVKGALCALILDLKISEATNNQSRLIDVLKSLYENHTYQKGGYSREQVYAIISTIGGESVNALLATLYESTVCLSTLLGDALAYVGCEFSKICHPEECTSKLGIKANGAEIVEIAPGSIAEEYLSVGDSIIKINGENYSNLGVKLKNNNEFEIKRGSKSIVMNIATVEQRYYDSYEISLSPKTTAIQRENLSHWLGINRE